MAYRENIGWVKPFIPRMIHDFRYGVYQRAGEEFYTDYRQRGGQETEEGLIKGINIFARIYESEGLLKPNGDRWQSEDELWDCWVAFLGSEPEAERICSTMENVLPPLEKQLREELGMDV